MPSTSLQSVSRHRSFVSPSIETPDLYHGYSESSSSLSVSPLTGTMAYDPVYTNLPLESTTPYTEMPYLYTPEPSYTSPPVQMIPVQLDIEGLYEEHDRRRKSSSSNEKTSNSAASNVSPSLIPIPHFPSPRPDSPYLLPNLSLLSLKTPYEFKTHPTNIPPLHSADVPRTAPPSALSATAKKST